MEEGQTTSSKKPMKMGVIVGVVVVVILLVGGFLLFGGRNATAPTTPPAGEPAQDTLEAEPTEVSEASGSVSVETKSFAFSPTTIKIKAGGTINFTNRDSVSHSFTADDGKSFDSGLVGKDQVKTITAPTAPGTYPFHCTPHPFMKGILIVE